MHLLVDMQIDMFISVAKYCQLCNLNESINVIIDYIAIRVFASDK